MGVQKLKINKQQSIQKLKMNKKGLELKSGIFALIAFSFMMFAAGTITSEWNTIYGSNSNANTGDLDRLENVSSLTSDWRGQITPNDVESGDDAEASTFRGVYGVLVGSFRSFDIVLGSDGIIDSLFERYALPNYLKRMLITLVLVGITFALTAIIFRLARRSA